MEKQNSKPYMGIILCFIIALPAYILGHLVPTIGAPIFGIFFGIIIGGLSTKFSPLGHLYNKSHRGIAFTSKKILQYAIVFLGFSMNLTLVVTTGLHSLAIIIVTITSSLVIAFVVGKLLHIDWKQATLIGVGTSICGGSAIAATSPVIDAKDEDVAHSISTIFLFNILAVFLFPFLGHLLHLTDTGFGLWAGTAVNDTSSVVATATVWSSSVGNNTALLLATVVKLTRTLMIIPITLVLSIIMQSKAAKESKGKEVNSFKLAKIFPWFVIYFLIAAIANTYLPIPDLLSSDLVIVGKFMIAMAMVAIGLNTNLVRLIKNGIRPIVLGLSCWFVVALASLAIQYVQNSL